jgi:hypothetical protein
MNKEFLPHEQSRALKELGFDEPCIGYYVGRDIEVFTSNNVIQPPYNPEMDSKIWFRAPLYQQAFRWFRKKYSWQHSIDATSDQHSFELGYNYWIWNNKTDEEYHTMPKNRPTGDWEYETHEEAELECLKKLIEIVKTK